MLTVDVHTHFIPAEVVAAARRGAGFDGMRTEDLDGAEWLVHRQGFRYPVQRSFYDLEARLRSMDERQIDHAVVSIAPPLFMYWADGAEAAGFCRRANDALAAFAAGSGGRITAVAALPMQDPDAAAAELDRAVGRLGMRGAEIGTEVEGVPLDDASLRPVLDAAARLGVPVILITDLRLVLMHGGGYLPQAIGRLDHGYRVRPESRGCRAAPSEYLTRFWFDTVTHAAAPLAFLAGLAGAGHVVYGTDYPYDMAAGPLSEQAEGTGLDAGSLAAIAGLTADGLFGLELAGRASR